MKQVSILALSDATMSSIDSAYQILTRVNDFLKYQGKEGYYKVEIVGCQSSTPLNGARYNIVADNLLRNTSKADLIVIPLLCGDFSKALERNKDYADWMISQYNAGAEIVCLCVGSFFLAATGLLDEKNCAVHWAARNEFQMLFPRVNVIDDTIITDEHGIYTCGGGYSFLNLLLYVIEKHLGREMSTLASKMFEIDIERKSQNPFMIFVGQKQHGDQDVLYAQNLFEHTPTNVFSIDEICAKLGIARRTFERRFKKKTGNSISEYIQRVKVEFVKKQLELTDKTVNEIIYEVGYNDIDAFRKIFKRFTDLSPIDYRRRYRFRPVPLKKTNP